MRDPMSWALPVFRAFGIPVKVHLFFFIVVLGLFLRQVKDLPQVPWLDVFLFSVVLLFSVILLHEFGHCFAARWVDGDAREILIWPLGGLAYIEVPHRWRPNFLAAAAGPAVNVLICLACGTALAIAGFLPSLNPIANPYYLETHNYRDGRTYTQPYAAKVYRAGTAEEVPANVRERALPATVSPTQTAEFGEAMSRAGFERALLPTWATWTVRAFWLSWVLLLFNLIPAYPLDGGQMLYALVWARTSHRQGVVVASYSGFAVAVVFLVASIAQNETMLALLALFVFQMSWLKFQSPDAEDGPFGYDFSAGYTSLERDDEPPPRKRKRPGLVARWWQVRKVRKLKEEVALRQRDEERIDQLLEKIARSGKESLTDDERHFLERASTRYRNRS